MTIEQEQREVGSIEDLMKLANGESLEEVEPAKQVEATPEQIPATDDVEEVPATPEQPVEAPATEEVVPVGPYTPTLSYSVKGEEKEFDPRFHGIIKTQEDEDFIRELMTKSDGLDSYKEKLDVEASAKKELEESLMSLNEKLSLSQGFYQNIVAQRDSEDWRGVMKSIGYDDNAILKMAIGIAKERELPEEQQTVVRTNRQLEDQNRMLAANQTLIQQNNANSLEQQEAALASQQTNELNSQISSTYAGLNETMTANGLNMFNEAIAVGQSMYAANPEAGAPSTADVIKATADKYAFMAKVVEPVPSAPVKRQATLPAVGAGNASQVGDAVSSMEDLQNILSKLNTPNY